MLLLTAGANVVTAQKIPTAQLPNTVSVATRARFRVTLNGFTVNRQTLDNAFQSDGKDDEIFFLVKVGEYQKTNNQGEAALNFLPLRTTRVMGDTNNQNGRVAAGTASSLGGLRTGDRFPSQEPWRRTEEPKIDTLPMLLWEGELAKGEAWTKIVPTVWEWDNGDRNLRDQWNGNVQYWLNADKYDPERVLERPYQLLTFYNMLGTSGVSRNNPWHVFGTAEDRPIGMKSDRGNDDFDPAWLTLSFEKAWRAAAESPTGKGKGIVEINYVDADRLAGDYTLYVQIERLP